nr:zinc knuckle CX2CX4HX4C [Tanacetum cinerariifolium]
MFGNEVNELHSDTNGDENAKMVTANDSQSIFHDHTDTSKQFDNTNVKNVGDKDNSSDKSDSSTNVGRKLSDSFVRMTEVAQEAWSVDGISALASSLGNPLIMDTMTANMCHSGLGRLNFARVLIKMKDDKEFNQTIKVQYRDGVNNIKWTKRPRTSEEEEVEKKKVKERRKSQGSMVNNTSEYYARRWNEVNRKQEYRKKQVVEKVAEKGKNTSNKEESKGK